MFNTCYYCNAVVNDILKVQQKNPNNNKKAFFFML